MIDLFICSLLDDLRPYALVQFLPCIAIPLMAILLPPMYTHSTYWLWAAGQLLIWGIMLLFYVLYLVICNHGYNFVLTGFYLLAKVEEATDKLIYNWTYHIVSGHTLKHLCAAMVPVFLTLMLAKRTVEPERYLSLALYSLNFSNLSLCMYVIIIYFGSVCLRNASRWEKVEVIKQMSYIFSKTCSFYKKFSLILYSFAKNGQILGEYFWVW